MADANYVNFEGRVKKINRRHRKLGRGQVRLVERDGIIVPVPARRARRRFPLTGLLFTFATFVTFKGLFLAHLGERAYGERIGALASGDLSERFGAWVMTADPITIWIAAQIVAPL